MSKNISTSLLTLDFYSCLFFLSCHYYQTILSAYLLIFCPYTAA